MMVQLTGKSGNVLVYFGLPKPGDRKSAPEVQFDQEFSIDGQTAVHPYLRHVGAR